MGLPMFRKVNAHLRYDIVCLQFSEEHCVHNSSAIYAGHASKLGYNKGFVLGTKSKYNTY